MNKCSFVYIHTETSEKPEKTLAFFMLLNVLLQLVVTVQVLNKMKLVEKKRSRGRENAAEKRFHNRNSENGWSVSEVRKQRNVTPDVKSRKRDGSFSDGNQIM